LFGGIVEPWIQCELSGQGGNNRIASGHKKGANPNSQFTLAKW
jgi:hypothetical protein